MSKLAFQKVILLCGMVVVPVVTQAQKLPPAELSFGFGTASYLGELNPYDTPIRSIFGPAVRWNLSCHYEQFIAPQLALRGGLSFVRIFGDDNLMENIVGKEFNYIRNLHFRNDLKVLSVGAVYYPSPTPYNFTKRSRLMPYLSVGLSVFNHDPKALGVWDDPAVKPAWVSLRPLKTEGQDKPYASVGVAIPLGVGIKYRLKNFVDISFEISYNQTFADYLDDVSTQTDQQNPSPLANRTLETIAAYSGRDRSAWLFEYLNRNGYQVDISADIPFQFGSGIPPYEAENAPRGNPGVKDSFVLTRVSLIFYLKPRIKCP